MAIIEVKQDVFSQMGLGEALGRARPGDEILMAPGTSFIGNITLNIPITLRAAQAGTASIRGRIEVQSTVLIEGISVLNPAGWAIWVHKNGSARIGQCDLSTDGAFGIVALL